MMMDILIAVVLDLLIGDPPNWPHPVRLIGRIITGLEKWIRKTFVNLKIGGFVLLICTVFAVVTPLVLINVMIPPPFLRIINIYLLYCALACKSLWNEANKVKKYLKRQDLVGARKQLAMIVGRDTEHLEEGDIVRGVVETVSENTVDGILSPLFYMLIGAPLGISLYLAWIFKAVSTLDSMVGYKQLHYADIGYASAKTDDFLNLIPARLGAVMLILSGLFLKLDVKSGITVFLRDRKNHDSPNSAHPESAVAGLLGIQLGGTNHYFGKSVYKPTIGTPTMALKVTHIDLAIKLAVVSECLLLAAAWMTASIV